MQIKNHYKLSHVHTTLPVETLLPYDHSLKHVNLILMHPSTHGFSQESSQALPRLWKGVKTLIPSWTHFHTLLNIWLQQTLRMPSSIPLVYVRRFFFPSPFLFCNITFHMQALQQREWQLESAHIIYQYWSIKASFPTHFHKYSGLMQITNRLLI